MADSEVSGLRIAVVGGASGVGEALVALLRDRGASVVSVDRNPSADIVADIGNEEGCEQAMRGSIGRLGGLDGLAVTAGIAGYATIEDTDEERWEHILDVNLVAAGLLTRHALAFSLEGFTHEWYRGEHWRGLGYASANDFRQHFIRGYFAPMDANNLLAQATKWWAGDISPHGGGSLPAALGKITGHFFVVPFGGDKFFPVEDCETEAGHMPHG